MRPFEALFAAHRSDVVAYCGWRAGSARLLLKEPTRR
jgi:hypothetical protein